MRHVAVFVVLVLVAVCPVAAQETTGGLQGRVVDEVGNPIAGAVVQAVGPLGKITTVTDTQGRFRFPRLAPGTYTASASYVGFSPVAAEAVRVILGEAVTLDVALQQAFDEEIAVYSDTVVIDFSESATATSIRQQEIDFLPRGRDFTDVVTFAAGAIYDNQGGGIMIDGATGLENRFVIDGINTTDPQE
ncbi:MAG: carboxypeptidase-like regulatory domain-containing protein, partial [Acidobacteriota bacterium]